MKRRGIVLLFCCMLVLAGCGREVDKKAELKAPTTAHVVEEVAPEELGEVKSEEVATVEAGEFTTVNPGESITCEDAWNYLNEDNHASFSKLNEDSGYTEHKYTERFAYPNIVDGGYIVSHTVKYCSDSYKKYGVESEHSKYDDLSFHLGYGYYDSLIPDFEKSSMKNERDVREYETITVFDRDVTVIIEDNSKTAGPYTIYSWICGPFTASYNSFGNKLLTKAELQSIANTVVME